MGLLTIVFAGYTPTSHKVLSRETIRLERSARFDGFEHLLRRSFLPHQHVERRQHKESAQCAYQHTAGYHQANRKPRIGTGASNAAMVA